MSNLTKFVFGIYREIFFPSPSSMNICCCCQVTSVIFNSLRPCGLACQAPLSKGFSRQEYWSGLLCPFPGDLLNPGVEPASLRSSAYAGRLITTLPFPPGKPL